MKNKTITQRRKIIQRRKMVAVMAAIFFVLGGITQINEVNVLATSLDSDVANDDFNEGTAVTGGTCRIIGEDGSYTSNRLMLQNRWTVSTQKGRLPALSEKLIAKKKNFMISTIIAYSVRVYLNHTNKYIQLRNGIMAENISKVESSS